MSKSCTVHIQTPKRIDGHTSNLLYVLRTSTKVSQDSSGVTEARVNVTPLFLEPLKNLTQIFFLVGLTLLLAREFGRCGEKISPGHVEVGGRTQPAKPTGRLHSPSPSRCFNS